MVILKIKSYFNSKRQRLNTTDQLDDINKIYDQNSTTSKIGNGLRLLKDKRDLILWMFRQESITETQLLC
jgi:hypothetical protein